MAEKANVEQQALSHAFEACVEAYWAEHQYSMQQLVNPLFEAIQQRLAAQDQDQEVKEAAISCAATVTAGLGDFTNGAYHQQIKVGHLHSGCVESRDIHDVTF